VQVLSRWAKLGEGIEEAEFRRGRKVRMVVVVEVENPMMILLVLVLVIGKL
jgi:hypothetical protein